MKRTEISAAEALKAFKTKPSVVIAKQVRVKTETGQQRVKFETKEVSLAAEHIIAAASYGDRVVIATVDGQKHESAVAA